ncbi:MAG: ABC transporter ATP-binding protein [Trebonia sp.]|jgi:peptide/nickel transport system ATP-binding protein
MSAAPVPGSAVPDSTVPENTLSVRDLTVSYRTVSRSSGLRMVPAVRGVSLDVAAGESYGLVGESGSGKSTAAMALTRYLPAGTDVSAGELSVAGTSVLSLDRAHLRAFRGGILGVVYQEPGLALNPTMPVGEQVAEVYRLHSADKHGAGKHGASKHGAGKHGAGKHGASRAAARADTLAAIERVRLADPAAIARRYPHELSGGQQQRIVIAMALAGRPRLLILDEPTTGLDSRVEAEIMALIDGLRTELGFASILISHNLPLVAAHCQRIGVLQNGVLVEEGTAADVLLTPRHPYTQALIAALPDINAARRAPEPDAAGDSPGATEADTDEAGATAATAPRSGSSDEQPLVTVTGLTKRYNRKTALRDVSFTIGHGEVLGLVGESGSGKSTLGLALAGLTGYEGTIRFAPRAGEAGRRDGRARPRVQVVFQSADASLNPRRTVRKVLARSIELLGGTQSVDELAARTGVAEDLLDKLPQQLSGGQKQRVAIARAFAGPVPLVICDEPTSALDVSSQARLLDLLTELQQRTGVSYLFISHDLAVVRQVSDRIGVLFGGELVELKAAEEVFERPEHPYTRSLVESALALRRPGR